LRKIKFKIEIISEVGRNETAIKSIIAPYDGKFEMFNIVNLH